MNLQKFYTCISLFPKYLRDGCPSVFILRRTKFPHLLHVSNLIVYVTHFLSSFPSSIKDYVSSV